MFVSIERYMYTLCEAPLVEDPAAALPAPSSASMEIVSWLRRLTRCCRAPPARACNHPPLEPRATLWRFFT